MARRGPAQFVGELSCVAAPNMPVETWHTSVRAATDVAALLLTRDCLKTLVTRVPEAEIALRACAPPAAAACTQRARLHGLLCSATVSARRRGS